MKKSRNVIRFGVGSAHNVQSHIWRLWVQKDEVYLGTRGMTKMFWKASLHKSGIWRIAMVSDLKRDNPASDRVIIKWQRPEEVLGWTPSINIFVSSIRPQVEFAPYENTDPLIQWFPLPREGKKLIFKIVFSCPDISIADGTSSLSRDATVVSSMKKANGETVWLILMEQDLALSEIQKVKETMAGVKINIAPTTSTEPVNNSRALLMVSEDIPVASNQPWILDICLGKENVYVENS